jgi:hypothetical protein
MVYPLIPTSTGELLHADIAFKKDSGEAGEKDAF